MKNKSTDELTKILWDYNNLHQKIEKADVIITLGSHDTRVAKRGAELFLQKYALLILFSGGFGRLTAANWTKTEAEVFADIVTEMGIPKDVWNVYEELVKRGYTNQLIKNRKQIMA